MLRKLSKTARKRILFSCLRNRLRYCWNAVKAVAGRIEPMWTFHVMQSTVYDQEFSIGFAEAGAGELFSGPINLDDWVE